MPPFPIMPPCGVGIAVSDIRCTACGTHIVDGTYWAHVRPPFGTGLLRYHLGCAPSGASIELPETPPSATPEP